MTFGVLLGVAALAAPVLAVRLGRRAAAWAAAVLVVVGLLNDAAPQVDLAPLGDVLHRIDVLGLGRGDGASRSLLVGALLWCGPAADVLVRRILDATRLPAPETAEIAGLRAGRWIGRLERWLLLLCIAGGQPALAVVPIGGKALFRYAEVVADARAGRPRLERANGDTGPPLTRDSLFDYVIVGSLASWTQAIALGLLVGPT